MNKKRDRKNLRKVLCLEHAELAMIQLFYNMRFDTFN